MTGPTGVAILVTGCLTAASALGAPRCRNDAIHGLLDRIIGPWAPSDGARSCQPGVEVAPGTRTLTRIFRSASSTIQLRAKLLRAALLAL